MRRYTRAVRRAILSAAAVSIALACPLVSGASPSANSGKPRARRAETGHITLRLRYKTGPWVTKLSLQLRKLKLTAFKLCGVWNWPDGRRFTCLAAGSRLPERTSTRMEQSPLGRALKRDDSPGWGMVGASAGPVTKAILSNEVTGNRFGTYFYRVTLRDLSGNILLTSNQVKLIWHR
jgi:hypothetical protein